MRTSVGVFLRVMMRRLGLTPCIKAVGIYFGLPDADKLTRVVDDYLRDAITPGSVVWDVGANRGRQTRLLSHLVGREGLVVSIEPEAANMGYLASAVWSAPNVTLINAALSDTDGTESLIISVADKDGHGHFLGRQLSTRTRVQSVTVYRGDTLVAQRLSPPPAFILIDVEGAEDRVITGLSSTLSCDILKGLLIEVHFGALDRSGNAYAPVQMERLIRSLGFKSRWLGCSHLVAYR